MLAVVLKEISCNKNKAKPSGCHFYTHAARRSLKSLKVSASFEVEKEGVKATIRTYILGIFLNINGNMICICTYTCIYGNTYIYIGIYIYIYRWDFCSNEM